MSKSIGHYLNVTQLVQSVNKVTMPKGVMIWKISQTLALVKGEAHAQHVRVIVERDVPRETTGEIEKVKRYKTVEMIPAEFFVDWVIQQMTLSGADEVSRAGIMLCFKEPAQGLFFPIEKKDDD